MGLTLRDLTGRKSLGRASVVVALAMVLVVGALWPAGTVAANLPMTAGTVLTVNTAAGAVTITDTRGVTAAYRIAPGAELIMYDRPAKLADLLPGLAVWFHATGGEIKLLTVPPAWQAPGADVGHVPVASEPHKAAGRLQYVDGAVIAIITGDGDVQVYRRTAWTEAYRGGGPVAVAALDPGDFVTVTVGGHDQREALRIEAQAAPYPEAELYRGRLHSVWLPRHELVLADVERLRHGRWEPVADWQRLALAAGAELYLQGEASDLSVLGQRGIGQTAYVAVAADGSDRALKATVMPRASALFMDAPAGVSYGRSEIVFRDEHGSVATGDSSILIRNGRLVDFFGLSPDGAFTVVLGPAPGTGLPGQLTPGYAPSQFAAVAIQETFLPHSLTLHWGQLETAGSGQVTIRYPRHFVPYQFELVSNHWSAAVHVPYGLAVRGRDLRQGGPGRTFDRFELDRQAGLPSWDALRLTGQWVLAASIDGELVALDVLPGVPGGGAYPDLMGAYVTAGTIAVDDTNDELLLEAPVTWNALARRWEPDKLDWPLQVPDTALWLGPDGPVAPGQVAPGTLVTVLRNDFDIHLVLVR